jgi:hypothetical protein
MNLGRVKLIIVKIPPSLTHWHQACDCGCNFRDLKTGIATAATSGKSYYRHGLFQAINLSLDDLKSHFSLVEFNRKKIVHALQQIIGVMNDKYLTSMKVIRGFKICG